MDNLNEDPKIRRQRYVCVSIVTPSDVDIRGREYFNARAFAVDKKIFLNNNEYNAAFDAWCSDNQGNLDDEFRTHSVNKPHIPILKIRGSYKTEKEARQRCQYLTSLDTSCDISIAPVGLWVPADGKRRESETEIIYAEKSMQELMKAKNERNSESQTEFNKRVRNDISCNYSGSATKTVEATSEVAISKDMVNKNVKKNGIDVLASKTNVSQTSRKYGIDALASKTNVSQTTPKYGIDALASKTNVSRRLKSKRIIPNESICGLNNLYKAPKVREMSEIEKLGRSLYHIFKKNKQNSSVKTF